MAIQQSAKIFPFLVVREGGGRGGKSLCVDLSEFSC